MNQKKAMLVVSFGTSYEETRNKTIGAIEKEIAESYPDWEIRRAFTSGMILRVLEKRDGLHIDNVTEAMEGLVQDGFRTVLIQPTHIINGDEYDKMVDAVKPYMEQFETIKIGEPLLSSSEDYEEVVKGVMAQLPQLQAEEALVLMGHGTTHHTDAVYAALDYRFKAMGYKNVFVGTVEGYPDFEQVSSMVDTYRPKKVILMPFMVVAGDHAQNDMAGEEEDAWKTLFEESGYEVECILKGLGEFSEIRRLYLKHVADMLTEE
ncbi:sirohydrochlorin cobaltochelatase [Sinanaerobacter sp. ZZT-01]|uniref:sirohydrochlorin cobaltochelatase n=1 Tax=Sinanaerobacter sp. ZZT-01 TaxID=3111540 RepID=UPI002D785712|nr:sirohydrochlorin cobaltochelatase [Sinanaerobacter sp. ZZT-01]WRR94674.1 sirohydrochlorin cobaltochelatase [Sinanaerobacter sp. ZZT-01]